MVISGKILYCYCVRNFLFVFLLSFFIIFSVFSQSTSRVSKIPITKKGNMSTVVLALVTRQNTINDGKQIYTFSDGLVFYFIIYPSNFGSIPAIKQNQNFTVNGEPYWQNLPETCDSQTIIYNAKTFEEQEPNAFSKIKLRKNTSVYIQKTVICGAPLPSEGIVTYRLFFGVGQTLEEFEFRFNLKDVY